MFAGESVTYHRLDGVRRPPAETSIPTPDMDRNYVSDRDMCVADWA